MRLIHTYVFKTDCDRSYCAHDDPEMTGYADQTTSALLSIMAIDNSASNKIIR